jgi:hypothetical protein
MILNMEKAGTNLPAKEYEGTAHSDDGVLSYKVNLYPQVEPWMPRTAVMSSMIKVEFEAFQPPQVAKVFFNTIGENIESVMLQAVKGDPWAWSKYQSLEVALAKFELREGKMIFFLSFSTQSTLSQSLKLSPIWESIIDEVEERFPGARPWSTMVTEVNQKS